MCFYNSMSKKAQQLAARYGRKSDIIEIAKEILEEQYRQSAFTNPDCAVVTTSESLEVRKWGLIPFWCKTQEDADKMRKFTYNARSETVFELPSFRGPILSKRCIVPSTGYFEWRHEADGTKTPYFIFVRDLEIFSLAGVCDSWQNKLTGEVLNTFSILTTQANELTGFIHNNPKTGNRMPVILNVEEEEKWLDPSLKRPDIAAMLRTFDAERMDAYTIKSDFLKKNPKDSSILL